MWSEFIKLNRLLKRHNVEMTERKVECFKLFKKRISEFFDRDFRELKILDVGCGKTYPFSLLMSFEGGDVTALDPQYIGKGLGKYLNLLYHNGFKVMLKSLGRNILFTPRERKILKSDYSSINNQKIKFVHGSVEYIPLKSNHFDVIFSHNVFEHVERLERAVSECNRVLKPDGLMYITYHPYTSISGAHHPEWFFPESDPPRDIPPWFHLQKDGERYGFNLDYGLNQQSVRTYKKIFSKYSTFLKEYLEREEGRKYLNKFLRNKLGQYTEEELLISSRTIIAAKRNFLD